MFRPAEWLILVNAMRSITARPSGSGESGKASSMTSAAVSRCVQVFMSAPTTVPATARTAFVAW